MFHLMICMHEFPFKFCGGLQRGMMCYHRMTCLFGIKANISTSKWIDMNTHFYWLYLYLSYSIHAVLHVQPMLQVHGRVPALQQPHMVLHGRRSGASMSRSPSRRSACCLMLGDITRSVEQPGSSPSVRSHCRPCWHRQHHHNTTTSSPRHARVGLF